MDVYQEALKSLEHPSPSEEDSSKTWMTPKEAYDKYEFDLSSFEMKEIFEFSEIYFVGLKATKLTGGKNFRGTSYFDDEEGFYRFVQEDHLAYRYELVSQLGKGTTAQVFSAIDHKENRNVAIKVMRSPVLYHRKAKAEIEMLERLKKLNKDGDIDVVQIFDHFVFRNHVCIVLEQLSENLWTVIRETNRQGFALHIVRDFAFSLVKVMDFLGKNKIMHGDLKTDNILLKQEGKTDIKIIDFGAAKYHRQDLTHLIQGLHFRAPEVILEAKYGREVDMWSVGVIVAELFTGKRLFPGKDVYDQLALGMEIFGVPPPEFLQVCGRAKDFIVDGVPRYADVESRAHKRGPPGCRELSTVLKNCEDIRFLDFIRECLAWNPKTRLTPSQALDHPFLTECIVGPDNDHEKSPSLPTTETSHPVSAATIDTRQESKESKKRKRSDLVD